MWFSWRPRCVDDLDNSLLALHGKVDLARLQLDAIERRLQQLAAKDTHETDVIHAIQAALDGMDLPPGQLEAINTQVKIRVAKLLRP